jgi:carboxypeptidase D
MVWRSSGRIAACVGLLLALGALGVVAVAAAPAPVEDFTPEPFPFSDRYPAEIILRSSADLMVLAREEIDIGNLVPLEDARAFPYGNLPFQPLLAQVYINDGEAVRLELAGLIAWAVPNESLRAFRLYGPGSTGPDPWPAYETFVARMETISNTHPGIVRMVSIGQSVQGRGIWMLKITDNPDVEEDEPEFKYTSTIHGDEAVGAEMTLRLAELLTTGYGTDPDLTNLVDEMEIWLCPIHNPDGYVNGSRYNANGLDLNRNFPDPIDDPVDDPAGRELEVQAMMNFGYDHRFVMGANYHGGALVVNYPWDSVPWPPPVPPLPPEYYAPDDTIFHEYSVGYAARNPTILSGGFPDGVTRGWEWYVIRGGMQDWAYHWQGEHHVTIEVSSLGMPPYNQMDTYWGDNADAMLWWMERALNGLRGRVYDGLTGAPLDATVNVLEIGKAVRTDPEVGDYHRLLLPGAYTVSCSAEGYTDQTWNVVVVEGTATIQDCALSAEGPHDVSASDSEAAGEPGTTVTHTFAITNTGTVSDTYQVTLLPGAWPAALLAAQVGPLESGEPGQAQVTVDIPLLHAPQAVLATDVLTVQIASLAEPGAGAEAIGTTSAVVDLGVALVSRTSSATALGGQPVTYTLVLTNTGAYTDTYTLSLDGNQWPAQVMPVQTESLAPEDSTTLLVRVDIPSEPEQPSDAVLVRGTSGWDAGLFQEQVLLTLCVWRTYLPLVVR